MKQFYLAKLYNVPRQGEPKLIDWGYLSAERDPRRTAWVMFSLRRRIKRSDKLQLRLSVASPADLGMTIIDKSKLAA